MTLVTLTTDFGTRDPNVAQVKGVLLSRCPEARLVDLSHEVSPHDVLEAALFVATALPRFPEGTTHLVVVDPGVGSERAAVAVEIGGQRIVCPDNGLLTLLLQQHPLEAAHVIEAERVTEGPVSATFHGRDLFAPAAARLACSADLEDLGPPAGRLRTLELPGVEETGEGLRGAVMHLDRFGSAVTNIPAERLDQLGGRATVEARSQDWGPLRRTYADVERGEPVALVGSSGYLELAIREGDTNARFGLGRGDEVIVRAPRP